MQLNRIEHKNEPEMIMNLPKNQEVNTKVNTNEREERNGFEQGKSQEVLPEKPETPETNDWLDRESASLTASPSPEMKESEINKAEERPEKEIKEIGTVGDFLYSLEAAANGCEDGEEKGKLIFQALKIRLALNAAGLNIYEVGVRKMGDNILGLYHPESKNIELSEDLLSDFSADKNLVAAAARYELMHKKGFDDKAAAQLAARQGRPHLSNFAYRKKQENFSREFASKIGIKEALDMYLKDIKKTKSELFEEYITKGIKIKYSTSELKNFIGEGRREKIEAAVRRKLAKAKIGLDLVLRFKRAVPGLYKHIKTGVDINSSVEEILIKLARENAN